MSLTEKVIGAAVGSVFSGLDSLFTSDEERSAAALAVTRELAKPHHMQALTNLKEAEHPSVFVSGWRPALGWLCVALLAYCYIGRDMLIILLGLSGKVGIVELLPVIDSGEIMTLVMALLGLGGMRSYEKLKGTARNR